MRFPFSNEPFQVLNGGFASQLAASKDENAVWKAAQINLFRINENDASKFLANVSW